MENFMSDRKNLIIAGLSTILGIIILCGICGALMHRGHERFERGGMHRMPNGEMMMGRGDMQNMMEGKGGMMNRDGKGMMNHGGDMASMMMDMNKGLEGKTGDAFDQAFLNEMIIHHEGAVDMAKLVLKTSKRPELIKLANDIIVAQTGEIKMMQDWNKAWFSK